MLLESDVTWKSSVEQKLRVLEDAIQKLNEKSASVDKDSIPVVMAPETTSHTRNNTERTGLVTQQHESGWEVIMDLNRGPGVIPASVVSEIAEAIPGTYIGATRELDLIDRGIISLADAEGYFTFYYGRLDHFLYRVLAEHDSLSSVRKSSALLTAAICVVGALHQPSLQYQACYQHFVHLASSRMFSKKNSHDDVRALCIGAFWLSDISWNLSGTAVRLAGELNLHRCIPKAPHTKRACYLRTRLYYLVYICDHHFSIAYGRPPLTRDFGSITPPTDFLKSEFATGDDVRLVSQIEIWTISTRIFDRFSLDPEAHLSEQLIPQLRRLSIDLDTWRADWPDRFGFNETTGSHPRKEAGLHYYFAKLFLCSHVFRKAPIAEGQPLNFGPDLKEFADMAVHASTSILQAITSDQEIQSFLRELPAYFDTMIAFAFVFLLRVTVKNPANIWMDKADISDTLDKLAAVLEKMTESMHSRHLLTNIAKSMRKLLDRFGYSQNRRYDSATLPSTTGDASILPDVNHQNWVSPTDMMFLEQFDFLNSPDADFNFDPDFWATPHP
ncbi:hypothetical protein LTR84_009523 [Exophiala bonariae]|uniref:Xylanolytic transcriptional activator regulatory domain-containing protein n=1 Tax=Exophiala bonariae TaxID=1690606 RepID=A0AAV9MUB1_9EURO|nr:hypothetical protein LTR84_009523 [Exophiala bonariae]